jgi:hypothetical protein
MVTGRRQVDRLSVTEVHQEATPDRTEPADHACGGVRRLAGGNLAYPEAARRAARRACEVAVANMQERADALQ